MSTGYVYEKLMVAVETLATGLGSLQERLENAYSQAVMLESKDFPGDLGIKWNEIKRGLTAEQAVGDEGKIHSTMSNMSNPEAQSLAAVIYGLFLDVARQDAREYPDF